MRVFWRLYTQKSHIIRMEKKCWVSGDIAWLRVSCKRYNVVSFWLENSALWVDETCLLLLRFEFDNSSIQPLRQQSSVTQELIEINSPRHVMLKKPRSENVRHLQTNPPVMKFHCWQSWHVPPTSRFSPQLAKNPAKQRLVRLVLFRVSSRSGLKKM